MSFDAEYDSLGFAILKKDPKTGLTGKRGKRTLYIQGAELNDEQTHQLGDMLAKDRGVGFGVVHELVEMIRHYGRDGEPDFSTMTYKEILTEARKRAEETEEKEKSGIIR